MQYVDYKELRVGNWVHIGKDFTISAQAIWEMSRGGMQVEPIELTPEILEGCGFSRTEVTTKSFNWDSQHTAVYYEIELKALNSISLKMFDDGWFIQNIRGSKKIKYLHELQNVLFALTGSELSVNLTAVSQ